MNVAVRSAAAILAVVAVAACGRGGKNARTAPSPAPIPTAVAHATTVRGSAVISGVIAPLQNVAISNTLSEPADSVAVNEGDVVRKGEVLAVLDTADLRASLQQAQSAVESAIRTAASADAKVAQTQYQAKLNIGQGNDQVSVAQAALRQAQQTLTQAQTDLQRDRQLLANGYISQQAVDQQNTLVMNDEAAVHSAQATLSSPPRRRTRAPPTPRWTRPGRRSRRTRRSSRRRPSCRPSTASWSTATSIPASIRARAPSSPFRNSRACTRS